MVVENKTKDIRHINDKDFEIVYGTYLGNYVARVYLNGEVCFDMDGELDTDSENEYIRCWLELEDC